MQEITLHIGLQKTGTTSLQKFFFDNRKTLKELGWLYPRTLRRGTAHHGLAEFFRKKIRGKEDGGSEISVARLNGEYTQFRQEIEGEDKILMSSESLQNVCPATVANYFGKSVTIIVYIREQTQYLVSSYAQAVKKQKMTLSLEEFEAIRLDADYAKFLATWESAFGREAIKVRIYDRSELEGEDIRMDFLALLELSEARDRFKFDSMDSNISLGGALLEFKRRLNAVEFETLIPRSELLEILLELAADQPELNKGAFWKPGFLHAIQEKHQASNRIVAEKYFPDKDSLFKPGSKLFEIDETRHTLADVARAIDGLQPRLGRRLLRLKP